MPATTIHFVRHGEVYNPGHVIYERLPGYHLSHRGERMVRATARFIAENPALNTLEAVYSSPLDRTRETAGIIVEALDRVRRARGQKPLTVRYDDRLLEAGNEFRGRRIGRGKGALWHPENLKLVSDLFRPSWGESYRQIADRVGDFVRDQVAGHPDSQILVVTHESPIWTYRHLLETGRPEHNMLLRKTALASITSITIDDRDGQVLGITYADPALRV